MKFRCYDILTVSKSAPSYEQVINILPVSMTELITILILRWTRFVLEGDMQDSSTKVENAKYYFTYTLLLGWLSIVSERRAERSLLHLT